MLMTIGMDGINKGGRRLKNSQFRIYLAGDSTVENVLPEQGNKMGWGQVISEFFTDDVLFMNEAKGGRSSKSFIEEGRLNKILEVIEKGDYLFIQFGHNDQKVDEPHRGTDPYTTYQKYLTQYIVEAREKHAIPVLLTSVNRRTFTEDGKLFNGLGEYPEAMRQLALSFQVPLIDLWEKSKQLYEQLGVEGSKRLFAWYELEDPEIPTDNTHFGRYGAREIAKLVVSGIKELQMPFAKYSIDKS